jgi:FlaA1/EpsC-like NDP-sugar epimerase
VQTIPDLTDLVVGRAKVDELREVGVDDLLGRDTVAPDGRLMRARIAGKAVLVTGAGGSIGSELCRQIIIQRPVRLVLFEISEVALYEIDKELRKLSDKFDLGCEIVAILGTVENEGHVREVMLSFGIDTLYHAAAYKHVPVVERNMLAGVDNNIFGTLATARAAVDAKVETFVLVSTDKAVSPPNIMGATKRFAELVLQGMQDEHPDITFCMVRFGNVLESSGSVVPLFREQIKAGGPVTVTHPQIIRYFMTIPEAAQLVIQAGAMAEGGDVFVLDMGQPVRILDLAERLIRLSGLSVRDLNNPDGDVEIEFTGLRPAEKLYEELLIGDNATGTTHPRIMRAQEEYVPMGSLQALLDELAESSRARDRFTAREVLKRVVHGYQPTNGIDDLVWSRANLTPEIAADNVIPLPPIAS